MCLFFIFNDTATTESYTLSLHDALPIFDRRTPAPPALPSPRHSTAVPAFSPRRTRRPAGTASHRGAAALGGRTSERTGRSEEHTSELQSRQYLVCRLLLEKKKNKHESTK